MAIVGGGGLMLRASKVRAVVKANGLPDDIAKSFTSPTHNAL